MSLNSLLLAYASAGVNEDLTKEYERYFQILRSQYYYNCRFNQEIHSRDCVTFGSHVYGLGKGTSDLDVSLCGLRRSVPVNRESQQQKSAILKELLYWLQNHPDFADFTSALIKARVPVLKLENSRRNIKIDVTVGDRTGHQKSQIMRILKEKFRSLRILSPLVKSIFKSRGLNESPDGTFNSFSILLLCVFILQLENYIPPLWKLFYDVKPLWMTAKPWEFSDYFDGMILDSNYLPPDFLQDVEQRCEKLARTVPEGGSPRYSAGGWQMTYAEANEVCLPLSLLCSFFNRLNDVLRELSDERKLGDVMFSLLIGDLAKLPPDQCGFCLFIEDPFESVTFKRFRSTRKTRDNTARTLGKIDRGTESVTLLQDVTSNISKLLDALQEDWEKDSVLYEHDGTPKTHYLLSRAPSPSIWKLHAAIFVNIFGIGEFHRYYDDLLHGVLSNAKLNSSTFHHTNPGMEDTLAETLRDLCNVSDKAREPSVAAEGAKSQKGEGEKEEKERRSSSSEAEGSGSFSFGKEKMAADGDKLPSSSNKPSGGQTSLTKEGFWYRRTVDYVASRLRPSYVDNILAETAIYAKMPSKLTQRQKGDLFYSQEDFLSEVLKRFRKELAEKSESLS